MRVLLINHPEADFLESLLYLGLCREFGADNVVDLPWKASYHGEVAHYPSLYGSGEGVTGPFAWFPAQTGRAWSGDEVCARIGEFDVVLCSIRDRAFQKMREILSRVGRQAIRHLALFDGQDGDDCAWGLADEFKPSVYFKRELLSRDAPSRVAGVRLLPCPFASPLGEAAQLTKDIPVTNLGGGNFFVGVFTRGGCGFSGARSKQEVNDRLAREFGGQFVGGQEGYDSFLNMTARSKIGVCFGGFGWDTFRQWEVPSFHGTLLMRNRSPQVIPNDFVDGQTCAEFNSLDELVTCIREYLDDDTKRERVALAGNALLREHHTVQARAKYVISEMMK
jgi:hypothetical protein